MYSHYIVHLITSKTYSIPDYGVSGGFFMSGVVSPVNMRYPLSWLITEIRKIISIPDPKLTSDFAGVSAVGDHDLR